MVQLELLDDQSVIACVVLTPVNANTVKIRQMAVDPDYQRQGFGHRLLNDAERIARQKGWKQAVLHAHLSALGFYKKAGYREEGEAFIEVTIPHKKMVKILSV